MTSKKAVTELYKERAYAYENKVCNKGDGWKEAIDHYDNIGHCLIQIEKDLEILDILREHLRLEEVDLINITMCPLDDSDVKKIREWLKNESIEKIKECVAKQSSNYLFR